MTDTSTPSLTQHLAAGVPSRGLGLAYGPTQNVDGAEFMPVALVTYGFGASDESAQWGVGGGGGGVAVPLGAYLRGTDGLTFRANSTIVLALLLPAVTAGFLLLARLLRR